MGKQVKKIEKVIVDATDDELMKLGIADFDIRTKPSMVIGYDQQRNPVLSFVNEYGTEMILIVLARHVKPFKE